MHTTKEQISNSKKETIRRKLEQDIQVRNLRMNNLQLLRCRSKYELMYESFHIGNWFYNMNQTLKHAKDPVFYIIATDWFNRWKRYTNFDYFMNFTERYLQLNHWPERPEQTESNKITVNYINSLDIDTKNKLNEYFDSIFLAANAESYPGVITNKELLYDKALNYMNFESPQSSFNYNIVDTLINGKDYFIVTRDIWKYFKGVYGGKEIKRYRIGHTKVNNEILIETKLKTVNLLVVKYKPSPSNDSPSNETSLPYLIEKPKYAFVSHKTSLSDLKKQMMEMFSFLNRIQNEKEIRLWILDPKYTYETFADYMISKYDDNSPRMTFPGFCLDWFSSKVRWEDIDDMITNRIIVLEYLDNYNISTDSEYFKKKGKMFFPFKSQHLSEFSKEFQQDIHNISHGKGNWTLSDISREKKYDKLLFNNTSESDNHLMFNIKKYFYDKYQLDKITKLSNDDMDKILLRWIENPESDKVAFDEEIKWWRENMDLLFDKNELILELGYTSSVNNNITTLNVNTEEKEKEKTVKLSQDYVLKKRERNKIQRQFANIIKNKHNNSNNTNKLNEEDTDQMSNEKNCEKTLELEEKMEEKCSYCGKVIEEGAMVKCEHCSNVEYCNSFCLNKDLRFHNKICSNLNENNSKSNIC